MKRLTFLFLLTAACGGAQTTATSTGPHVAGVCMTASLGVCQIYYDNEPELADARTACTNSDVPETNGSWLTECPSERRIGDCSDANGNRQARFYSGGTQFADAESAENACEGDGGTWVP